MESIERQLPGRLSVVIILEDILNAVDPFGKCLICQKNGWKHDDMSERQARGGQGDHCAREDWEGAGGSN